jgi:hypothetical protein
MKRSQAFPSRYLAQADVVQPVLATIAAVVKEEVRDEGGMVDKTVMTFAETHVKPLIVNNVNWMTCENAYGDESDGWYGRQIEIYADPSVMFGRERVGGVRVRIPAAGIATRNGHGTSAGARNGATAKTAPAPAPIAPPPPAPEPTLDERHAQALAGFAQVQTAARLDEWARWARTFPFDARQEGELEDAYRRNMDRLAPAPARRAARASA